MTKFTTGVKALDKLIGGIECGAITQFFGEFGSGKSILMHQLCVTVQLEHNLGGLNSFAIYIDNEGSFNPLKIEKIAKRFNVKDALKRIFIKRTWSFDDQLLSLKLTEEYINKYGVKLIIIDSVISHLRGEFPYQELLLLRQSLLKDFMNKLLDICSKYDVAGIITNQVLSITQDEKHWMLKPVGGNLINQYCKYIIKLGKFKDKRYAKIFDAPEDDTNYVFFEIKEDGIYDLSP
jgi:RecA/RadA recombinase